MKRRSQDFALGLTAIAILALLVGTIIFLYPRLGRGGRLVTVHFRHEHGMAPLQSGSPVLLGGSMEVGRVRSVHLAEVPDPAAPGGGRRTVFVVQAEIRPDVPLYGNCQITTGEPTIGGSGFLLITRLGTPDVPFAEPVLGAPPQSLSAAIGTLSERLLGEGGLVDQLNRAVDPQAEGSVLYRVLAILDDIGAVTGELRFQVSRQEELTLLSKVHALLGDLNATTAALRAQMDRGNDAALLAKVHLALDHLGAGLAEAAALLREERPRVHDTLASLEHAARTIDQELLAALRAELDAGNPASALGKVHAAMDRVNASLDELRVVSTTGARLVTVSRPTLERTLANFEDMSAQLRLASQEVLLNPSKLIWGPKPQREEQMLVFQAARSFAEAASALDDAAGRLEAVLATLPAEGPAGPPVGAEIEAIRAAVRAAFQRFERAEQALWEQLK